MLMDGGGLQSFSWEGNVCRDSVWIPHGPAVGPSGVQVVHGPSMDQCFHIWIHGDTPAAHCRTSL